MPAGKRRQSNAMLYTLITFVGLFVAATTVAVIYYVKAEELRTRSEELQAEMNQAVTADERRNLASIVGAKLPGQKSFFGTLCKDLDEMILLVKGAPIQETTAEVKVASTQKVVDELLKGVGSYIPLPVPEPNAANAAAEPNATGAQAGAAATEADAALPAVAGARTPSRRTAEPAPAEPNAVASARIPLISVIRDLLAKLAQTTELKNATEKQLSDVQGKFNNAVATWEETQKKLAGDVDSYRQQVAQIKADYNDLRTLVEKNSDERVKVLLDQIEQAKAESKKLNQDLLRTQAELSVAQGRLQGALASVRQTEPAPDRESVAYKPDGEVILVDDAAGVIRINLGSDDHIYRGLTFSVYDRSAGVTRDGKPKAQVEVFMVDRRASAARVVSSDKRNPILTGDIIANLIWDSSKHNQFVIAGDFDLNGDKKPDFDGVRKIEALIQKWGGTVANDVSADTDFVILGTEPQVPPEPTPEILTADPTATDKYNAARQNNERYDTIRQRAESLWVPIFNYDRFLYFTGYASQIGKPGAF
jgi:hypothetical protein